jgi:hypothetical protein
MSIRIFRNVFITMITWLVEFNYVSLRHWKKLLNAEGRRKSKQKVPLGIQICTIYYL